MYIGIHTVSPHNVIKGIFFFTYFSRGQKERTRTPRAYRVYHRINHIYIYIYEVPGQQQKNRIQQTRELRKI